MSADDFRRARMMLVEADRLGGLAVLCHRCRRPSRMAEHWRWTRLAVGGVEVGRICGGCATLSEQRELDEQRAHGQRPTIEVGR